MKVRGTVALRLMAVHAHPDDESSKGAATYAAYVARGAEVMIVSCTGGEAGDVLNEGLESKHHAARDIGGLRRFEMKRAAEILGVQHRWLGYADSGLPPEGVSVSPLSFAGLPLEHEVRPLVRLMRSFRPHVVVTYDERGGYPHPDHIRSHELSMLAWDRAAAAVDPELGEPWAVQKLYYERIFSPRRGQHLFDAITRVQGDSVDEKLKQLFENFIKRPNTATTHVPVGEWFEARDRALCAHASQVDPAHGFFFGWPRDVERESYPFEDYELVRSRVQCSTPEDDLFACVIEEPSEPLTGDGRL